MRTQLLLVLAAALAISTASISAQSQSRRFGTRGITVYSNPNFTGESATFRDDMPDLRAYGLNDKVSSIEIPNGEAWELCQDINFANRCQVFTGSVSDLRSMGWNDRVSSLRRVDTGYGRRGGNVYSPRATQARLLFFDRPDFRGTSRIVTETDSDLTSVGRPRSVEVRGGTWRLCDRSGRCALVSDDVADLAQIGLNARLRSATLVGNRGYNGNRANPATGWPSWRP